MQEAKRRRVVFSANAEMPSADTAPYLQWKNWRGGLSSSAVVFLSLEDGGAMAAAHHARLLLEGDLQGVDLLTRWAGPDMETHEVLLLLAMFERVSGLVLDVTCGEWIRQGTHAFASASSDDAHDDAQLVGEGDLQSQIDECERRLQELCGPRVPAFSHEAMTRLAGGQLSETLSTHSSALSKRIPARLRELDGRWLKMFGGCCIDHVTLRLLRLPAGSKCRRRLT
jgi:hypothetical protein